MSLTAWFLENSVDLIGHTLTALGIIAAAATVAWQLARQHKSSLQLQKNNAREALKLELHEILIKKTRALTSANIEAAMYAYMIPLNLQNYQNQKLQGLSPKAIEERAPTISRLHHQSENALFELIEEFEAWSIAFPGIEIFQTALNSANHDAREAFQALYAELLVRLPTDLPHDPTTGLPTVLVPNPMTKEQMAKLNKLTHRYKDAMDEIGSYVHDLTVESQNNLLSGLFERRVPLRKPIDPKHKVITTEPEKARALEDYFENKTAWGKKNQRTEALVRSRILATTQNLS